MDGARRARRTPSAAAAIVPASHRRYLAEIAETVRGYHAETAAEAGRARTAQQVEATLRLAERRGVAADTLASLEALAAASESEVSDASRRLLASWPATRRAYGAEELAGGDAGNGRAVPLRRHSLAGTAVPRVALPRFEDHGELLGFLRSENLPGRFPFTAGVFPFKRDEEDPTRMFAGEGDPARTNRRFHLLAAGQPSTRLSTAFDSVTLYGFDPAERPDIYGKVGTSGVSVATLEDMAALFDGFDLCDRRTSVSMTINGPAPVILAMFLNAAIDQQLERFCRGERPRRLAGRGGGDPHDGAARRSAARCRPTS